MTTVRVSGKDLVAITPRLTKVVQAEKVRNFGECVVLEAFDQTLRVSGANSSTTLSISIPLEQPITETVGALVTGKLFLGISSKLGREAVSISFGRQVIIETETDKFKLGAFDTTMFPYRLDHSENVLVEMEFDRQILAKTFSKILFCAAGKDTAQSIAGAMLDLSDNRMRIVAVEHNMMAMATIPCETNDNIQAIVSVPFCVLMPPLVKGEGPITLGITENEIFVKDKDFKLVGRRLARDLLPYEQILFEPNYKFKIDKGVLIKALDKAQLFTSTISNAQKFGFVSDTLTLECSDPQSSSEGRITIPGTNEGEDVDLHFEAGDWLGALSSIDNSEIEVGILGEHQRIRIDDEGFSFIIQPILR